MRFLIASLLGGAVLAGCKYDIQTCTPDQEAYISASMDWMHDHPAEIDSAMDAVWPTREITFQDILDGLDATQIECGVPVDDETDVGATMYRVPLAEDKIIVDVKSPTFADGLALYDDTEWVTDYSQEELADPTVIDYAEYSPVSDMTSYTIALGQVGLILAHEGGHVELGGHSAAAKKVLDGISEKTPENTKKVDEIYGWGYAVQAAVPVVQKEWNDTFSTY